MALPNHYLRAEKNIRVNGVCPVNILTEGLKDAFKSNYSPVNKNTLFYLKEFTKQQSALSKLPTKEDIANFVTLLPIRQGILLDNHSILIVGGCQHKWKVFYIKIKNICVELFKKKKVSKNIYNSVVNCLIESSLRGVDTHGIRLLSLS